MSQGVGANSRALHARRGVLLRVSWRAQSLQRGGGKADHIHTGL